MRIASKKRMRVVKDEGKTEDAVQRKRATRGFTWWRQWRRSVARGESYYFILIAMNNAAECNVEGGGCRSARRVRRERQRRRSVSVVVRMCVQTVARVLSVSV